MEYEGRDQGATKKKFRFPRKIFNSKKFMGASQRDLFCNIGNKKTAQIPLFLFPPFILFNYLPSMSLYAYSLKWRRNLIKNIIKFTLEAKNIGNFYEHFSKIKWLVHYLTTVPYFLIIFQYTYTEKRYGTKKGLHL